MKHTTEKKTYNILRILRKQKGKTIYELGKDLNLSPSTIAMIERGERGITTDNAILFSKYFGVSIDFILGIDSDNKNTKGIRLRQLRKERGLTLKELASQTNMALTTISSIESGQNNLTVDNALLFANYFGVSTDYLLGKSNIRNLKKDSLNFVIGGYEKYLTENDKEIIINLARSLANKNMSK